MSTADEVYWDPYDHALVHDPYPIYKRMREEAPLYYNEKYDFYAVSRHADVQKGLGDWQTFSSARGDILELIQAGICVFLGVPEPIREDHVFTQEFFDLGGCRWRRTASTMPKASCAPRRASTATGGK